MPPMYRLTRVQSIRRVGVRLGIVVALLVPFLGVAATSRAQAQSGGEVPIGLKWSLPPQHISGYDNEALAPYLIADQNHNVYAFNSVWIDTRLVIVYSQWNKDAGWSSPVDILISPLKLQARILGAFLDQAGYVHIAFFGGDDISASIFYSKAPLAEAGNAAAWTPLAQIADSAISPTTGGIIGDGKGNLYVLYSASYDGVGLYAVYSSDGGDTWTDPSKIFAVPDDLHWPSNLDLTLDDQGNLQAVWTMVNNAGNGDAVYYARLEPATHTWTDPYALALRDPGDYEADWGSIVFYKGQLFVIYDDSQPATRWMRRSLDGGKTWSPPVRPFSYVGEYGQAEFIIDSAGFLHMFLGDRTVDGSEATHGMWHSVWLGDRWSDLEPVVSGPRVTTDALPGRFDPTKPKAVLVNGNLILLTWSTDPGAGKNGVWSSFTTLNSPEYPAKALVTPVPTLTPTPYAYFGSIGPRPTMAPVVAQIGDTPTDATLPSPMKTLVAAIIAAFAVSGGVLMVFRSRIHPR